MARLAWLDALRGWAILLVVVVHVGQIIAIGLPDSTPSILLIQQFTDLGQYGVQLFFVVSAITICLTLNNLMVLHGTTRRTIIAWYIKRIFRLAPLFYFTIIIYSMLRWGLPLWFSIFPPVSLFDTMANILFVHSWVPSAINNVVPGAWSLGVECSFYAIAPSLVLFRQNRFRHTLILSGLIVLSLLATVITTNDKVENNLFYYFWFPTQFPVFAAGIVAYLWFDLHSQTDKLLQRQVQFWLLFPTLGFAAVGAWFGTIGQADHAFAPLALGISFAFGAMSIAGSERNLAVNPISIFLGRLSYGIYLLHYIPILVLRSDPNLLGKWLPENGVMRLLILTSFVLITSTLAATILKKTVELPGIAIGNRIANRYLNGTARYS